MNDDSLYKGITDSLDVPVIIAKEIDGGANYEIEYLNRAAKKVFRNAEQGNKISSLNNDTTNFVELARKIKDGKTPSQDELFFQFGTTNYSVNIKFTGKENFTLCLYETSNSLLYDKNLSTNIHSVEMLPGRMQFNKEFFELIQEYENSGKNFGLLLFDLDNIKMINDSKSQAAGDRIIITASKIFKCFAKENIDVFRFADDGFAIIAKDISSLDSAVTIADAVHEAFANEEIGITGGIAIYPDDSPVGEDLLVFAGLAMRTAKAQGKRRTLCFLPEMHKAVLRKNTYKSKMQTAFENKDFELYFQPQFDIANNSLRGFESLLRWTDSKMGRISPQDFIPIAEETGFIVKLGEWIMDTAFKFQKKWETEFNYKGVMSVNISPIQLGTKNFIEVLLEKLNKYDLKPTSIEIEITEGVFIQDAEDVIDKLTEIKSLGFGISLDDFGTGYSSLRYLQILPLTTLKIDKSFVQSITEDSNSSVQITDAIISMVTKMGLDTIAEGVENLDQLKILEALNCKNVQGFLRGKPMDAAHVEAYLAGDNAALDKL